MVVRCGGAGGISCDRVDFSPVKHLSTHSHSPVKHSSTLFSSRHRNLGLPTTQKKLAKSLDETVAKRLIQSRQPLREFLLEGIHDALAARRGDRPGLWGYISNTPHTEAATFVTHYHSLDQPFILIPDPTEFDVEHYLGNPRPLKVPSDERDASHASLVGRIDWGGAQVPYINFTASLYSCPTAGCTFDLSWIQAALKALPSTTSLYDTVTLLPKMSVALVKDDRRPGVVERCDGRRSSS